VTHPPRKPVSLEAARQIVRRLALERERLRRDGAAPEALEANRLSLAYWQGQMNRALIADHTAH
jgi:hypothetical protein